MYANLRIIKYINWITWYIHDTKDVSTLGELSVYTVGVTSTGEMKWMDIKFEVPKKYIQKLKLSSIINVRFNNR